MIERKFIAEKVKDLRIRSYLESSLQNASYSHADIIKTPLGMKLVIYSSKPGLVVGRGGQIIKDLSTILEKRFKIENPQIEVREVKVPELDAQIMSERIAFQLQKWGVQRFKKVGYAAMTAVMNAGARGVEIRLSGKVPSKRATMWPFRAGFIPKTGYVSHTFVDVGFTPALLKLGIIGISVKILRPDIRMPDDIRFISSPVLEEAKTVEVKKKEKKVKTVVKKEKVKKKKITKDSEKEKNEGKGD